MARAARKPSAAHEPVIAGDCQSAQQTQGSLDSRTALGHWWGSGGSRGLTRGFARGNGRRKSKGTRETRRNDPLSRCKWRVVHACAWISLTLSEIRRKRPLGTFWSIKRGLKLVILFSAERAKPLTAALMAFSENNDTCWNLLDSPVCFRRQIRFGGSANGLGRIWHVGLLGHFIGPLLVTMATCCQLLSLLSLFWGSVLPTLEKSIPPLGFP